IWCVWVVGRRREQRAAAAAGGATGPTVGMILLLLLAGGALRAQQPVVDTTHRGVSPPGTPGSAVQGRAIDTATARRLGLPTGPPRPFPPPPPRPRPPHRPHPPIPAHRSADGLPSGPEGIPDHALHGGFSGDASGT